MSSNTVQILDLLHSVQEACPELYDAAKLLSENQFIRLHSDMSAGISTLLSTLQDSLGGKRVIPICQSVEDTLYRIKNLYSSDIEYCLKKIEFELLPLLQEAYASYFFFQYLSEHPEELPKFYSEYKNQLYANSYIDAAMESGQYKYELSIHVFAYNKLDYTRMCVESILNNIPEGLNYELILVNHGSSDGTKGYFESVHPDKQLDIAVNGGGRAAVWRIVEGKYTLAVSNDVIIAPNTISNLLECIRSDPSIAWVVPSTPNVSNLQTIPGQYNSLEEMKAFALQNNRSDPFRWEQRIRLCNPIDIRRNDITLSSAGINPDNWFHTADIGYYDSFPDDRMSLLLRRNGYKLMLAKDAYCYHFGSVTLKDEIHQKNEQKYYFEGRREFMKAFNIDPWGTGFCYDSVFFERVVDESQGHMEVLGVNCGLGSNSLKIKEQIKEYCHNTDCRLTNITDDKRLIQDLKGISDEARGIFSINELKFFLVKKSFNYIVWESEFLIPCRWDKLLTSLMECLGHGGKLFLKLNENARKTVMRRYHGSEKLGEQWIIIHKNKGKR